ncbi:MAG: MBL fold metallo-hydrolase [Erysipelotrichaceae bacterium]|nr:MBL fold metallo-hydrolase [Erysipelotrichaceae bacterium]
MEKKTADVIMPVNWYDALPRKQYESFIRIESADPWFSVYQIRNNIYAIYEDKHFQEVISYLITGKKKALLIDTGLGIGDIRAVVKELYEGEVIVTHTHTHFDHIGGDWQFDEVFIPDNPVAVSRARRGLSKQEVEDNMAEGCNCQPYPRGFSREEYCIKPANRYSLIRNGDVFDLGDIRLEVIETPGHSPDSVMYLDRENQILFTGDSFYPATLYAHITHNDGSNSDFETYRRSMHMVAEKYSNCTLITSHNEPLRPGIELIKVAQAFDIIAEGSSEYITDSRGLKKYVFEDFCIVTS